MVDVVFESADGSRQLAARTVFVNDLEPGQATQHEAGTFTPGPGTQITVSGGGPSGLALDEPRNRLYVLTRFDDAISVVDLASKAELQHFGLVNPEPTSVTAGRPFLYDALASRGAVMDFVGRVESGPASFLDRDHEGYPGAQLNRLYTEADAALATARPDVILLMGGTNDTTKDTVETMVFTAGS